MIAQPVALNQEAHKDLKIIPRFSLESVQNRHVVPLMLQEVPAAAVHYPVFFLQVEENRYAPVAVFGLREGQNVFIKDDKFEGEYIPANIRSYPFTLVQASDEQLVLCINEQSDVVSTTEGQALFAENGERTEFFEGVNKFFRDFIDASTASRNVMEQLSEMGLFRADGLQYRDAAGNDHRVNGFFVLDREKFDALSDEQFVTLRKLGVLPAIYAHFNSLDRISNLIRRLPV